MMDVLPVARFPIITTFGTEDVTARLPRRTRTIETMEWGWAEFRIPSDESLKLRAWTSGIGKPVEVFTKPLRETYYTLERTDPKEMWSKTSKEYRNNPGPERVEWITVNTRYRNHPKL
jgi:hypothetical protein